MGITLMDITWFDVYVVFGGIFWYITLPLGFAVLGLGVVLRKQSVGVAFSSIVIGILVLGAPVFYGAYTLSVLIKPPVKAYIDRWNYARRTWHLEQPSVVAGINFPKGTVVQLAERADPGKQRSRLTIEDLDSVVLPKSMTVFGVMVDRKLQADPSGDSWLATLPRDTSVEGHPCSAGTIRFWYNGSFGGCTSSLDGQLIISEKIGLPR